MTKPGRNDPCPCDSGKKYKRCCAGKTPPSPTETLPFRIHKAGSFADLPDVVKAGLLQKQLKEASLIPARVRRYGHVRGPVIVEHGGYKVLGVGHRIIYVKKHWKTFQDVLHTYIAQTVGVQWGRAEIAKPYSERHPIMQWYHDHHEFQRTRTEATGSDPYRVIATGPAVAYLTLAYDLFTLENNAKLPPNLLNRLKHHDQFQGARYECYVAASFLRAGFNIHFENEADSKNTHCEFNATCRTTNAAYSIEAKSRHRAGYLGKLGQRVPLEQIRADVYSLLQDALRKKADHPRIIFIDANVPPEDGAIFETDWFKRVAEQVRRLEDTQGDRPYPAAFTFFTNRPDHYAPIDELRPEHSIIFTGLNRPEFRQEVLGNDPILAQHRLLDLHPAVGAIHGSLLNHAGIPEELEW